MAGIDLPLNANGRASCTHMARPRQHTAQEQDHTHATHVGILSEKCARTATKRTMPYIFDNDRLDQLLSRLLSDQDYRLCAYVYRMQNGEKVTPALFRGAPYPNLLDWLRDSHNGGEFHIIIRRARRMELSGVISIWSRLSC